MLATEAQRERFESNPARYIERAIKKYVATSPNNRLPAFPEERIWEEPLVGFADGDAPLFQEYKEIIGDFHLTPREALTMHRQEVVFGDERRPSSVGVISWVLPSTRETRLSMRCESVVPSLRWNQTRWYGQDFNFKLARYLVSLLETLGHEAVAPELMKSFEIRTLDDGAASNWSQRHIAYAAGLGTFSLSDGLITPKGIAMRAGSVVCDLALPPTPRIYENHVANCLFHRDGSCGRCIERCPAGAIGEHGHDKIRCREFLFGEQSEVFRRLGREGYVGRYLGCGLCQTGVPCEAAVPSRADGEG